MGEGTFTGEGYYYGGDGLLYGTGVLQGSGECETGEVEVLLPSAPLPPEIALILASRSHPFDAASSASSSALSTCHSSGADLLRCDAGGGKHDCRVYDRFPCCSERGATAFCDCSEPC